jgi:hypothetical protein
MVYSTNITSITSNTTLSTLDDVYLVNATSGPITITLPNITTDGMQYKLKRIDTVTSNIVTVQGFSGGQTLDGLTSVKLYTLTNFEVQSFNTVWYIIANGLGHGSQGKALFTSAFVQNNGSAFITFSGNNSAQAVCQFYYPGSNIEAISKVTVVLGRNGGTPTGTVVIVDQATSNIIATIAFSGLTVTSQIFTTTTIANLPTAPSVLLFNITIGTPNANKVNVYSLTIQ